MEMGMDMRIIVCAKQVPDTNEVKIDPVKGTLIRDGVPSILNPDDANALEAALSIKDENPGATVSVISMGPQQAAFMLRECLAMGADEAFLLSARAFSGADTIATSAALAAGIRKIGAFDILLGGRQAIDGDTAQVGPQIAQRLGIPVITYVQRLRSFANGSVVVERQLEDGYEVVECPAPCMLTCIKELNEPRHMSVGRVFSAYEKKIAVWDEKDVGLHEAECGLKASPTRVFRSFAPEPKGKGEMLGGSVSEMARALAEKLHERRAV
jgi:electron transfer flavoprotein beta subunit